MPCCLHGNRQIGLLGAVVLEERIQQNFVQLGLSQWLPVSRPVSPTGRLQRPIR